MNIQETIRTFENSTLPRAKIMAPRTSLASMVRINLDYPDSFSTGFIFDELLQLVETPIIQPSSLFLSQSSFSYVSQVFHYNSSTFNIINNLFADIVVIPSHKLIFSARNLFKQSFTGSSAFCLEFSSQISKSILNEFNFSTIKEFVVATNSDIIYADIDTKNCSISTIFSIDVFSNSKVKEQSSLFILNEHTFNNLPIFIFNKIVWNFDWNFNPSFDGIDTQDIIFNRETSAIIITGKLSLEDWFRFSFLNNFGSLFQATNNKLGLKLESTFNNSVNFIMQLDIIPNLVFPSIINTELQGSIINLESLNKMFIAWNFQLDCADTFHNNHILKEYINLTEDGIPPKPKDLGILPTIIWKIIGKVNQEFIQNR